MIFSAQVRRVHPGIRADGRDRLRQERLPHGELKDLHWGGVVTFRHHVCVPSGGLLHGPSFGVGLGMPSVQDTESRVLGHVGTLPGSSVGGKVC